MKSINSVNDLLAQHLAEVRKARQFWIDKGFKEVQISFGGVITATSADGVIVKISDLHTTVKIIRAESKFTIAA